jgi:hypothetical protein
MTYPIIDAQVATANITSNSVDMDGTPTKTLNLGVQVNATSLNSADAVVKVQHSNDNVNFADVTDASLTLASGTSTQILSPITNIGSRYYRVVFTKNTNSAGSLTVIFNFN